MLTDRERFHALTAAQPMTGADCVVLLTGDGLTRVPRAWDVVQKLGGPPLIVAGGVDAPPYCVGAANIKRELIACGFVPERVMVESSSQNTAESAVFVSAIAKQNAWKRIVLVTSAYHMPRAVLSFIRAMARVEHSFAIVPVAVVSPWFESVEGVEATRLELADGEAAKTAEYQAKGDVASYAEGIEYWRTVEGA